MKARKPPQSFHVRSFGCQMNVYDGERMGELLSERGFAVADDAASADLVVLNSCHIRDRAVHKAYSEVGTLVRADGSRPMIALAGCVAQAEGPAVIERTALVDVVVGPQAYHRLPDLIARAAGGERCIDTDMPADTKFDALPQRAARAAPSAFLTIQEGCDKFCTYCVVPYTRGAEISRPMAAVLAEAERLVAGGALELTLLGQNVNAWSDGAYGFHDLIHALDRLPGLQRIRYTTSHPRDMTDGLIDAHRTVGKLMPYLHLPVQSGSDSVLRAMNRGHSRDSYVRLIERVRAARPDIAISGDFIVGFPGESDRDFEDTMQIVAEVGYAAAFSFAYSERPGTPAAGMAGQLPAALVRERLHRLQAEISAGQHRFNAQCVGKVVPVLFDRPGKLPNQLIGKSPWLQSVHMVDERLRIGDLVPVEIVSAGPNSLVGRRPSGVGSVASPEGFDQGAIRLEQSSTLSDPESVYAS